MNRGLVCFLLLVLIIVGGGALAAPDKVDLKYHPTVGQEMVYALNGEASDVSLGGSPVGVTGKVALDLASRIIAVGDKDFTQELTAKNIQADLNNDVRTPPDSEPMKIKFGLDGAVLGIDAPNVAIEVFDTGGAPIPLLVVAFGVLQFKGEPVGVGDTWTTTGKAALGGIGELTLQSESRLVKLTDSQADIETRLQSKLPAFSVPNPFAPGTNISIAGGDIRMDNLKRTFDYQKGQLVSSSGSMTLSLKADMGGGGDGIPVSITLKAELTPKPAAYK
jgi:hypothetical protein